MPPRARLHTRPCIHCCRAPLPPCCRRVLPPWWHEPAPGRGRPWLQVWPQPQLRQLQHRRAILARPMQLVQQRECPWAQCPAQQPGLWLPLPQGQGQHPLHPPRQLRQRAQSPLLPPRCPPCRPPLLPPPPLHGRHQGRWRCPLTGQWLSSPGARAHRATAALQQANEHMRKS